MDNYATRVGAFVGQKLGGIRGSRNEAQTKALLANLRRGIGRAPGDLPELWGLLLEDMPPELASVSREPSYAEWAVYLALTLYALHQQGSDPGRESVHKAGVPLGRAVRRLVRTKDDEPRIKRRFDAAATANGMEELSNHLRGLIQLMKAEGVALDYVSLAADLYRYQFESQAPSVRLQWGRDFYRIEQQTEQQQKTTEGEETKS